MNSNSASPRNDTIEPRQAAIDQGSVAELLARVEAATGPDRELDFAIFQGLGVIPPEAVWEQPDDDSALQFAHMLRRGWELPAYREAQRAYRAKVRAYIETRPQDQDEIARWHNENRPPYEDAEWRARPPIGSVPKVTASLEAALALVERVLPGAFSGLQQNAHVPDERRWSAWVSDAVERRFEWVEYTRPTAALALLAATLHAASATLPQGVLGAGAPIATPDAELGPGRNP